MSVDIAHQIARSLMFEGYVLYPYRRDSLKNQKRVVFGSLYPARQAERTGERSGIRAEVLVRSSHADATETNIQMSVLFLRWVRREAGDEQPWLEAEEHQIDVGPLSLAELERTPCSKTFECPSDAWEKEGARFETADALGRVVASAEPTDAQGVHKLVFKLQNHSISADHDAELASFGSAHLLIHVEGGALISLLEPPDDLREIAKGCTNDGVWPVLVGAAGDAHTMLASPITLYDFPAVAPESPGDYCDATEMDEMLALRVRTLTELEKEEARRTDPRARSIIDRSEALSDPELANLHGAWREPVALPNSALGERVLRPGDRVRLRPRPGRDILDLALAGELATVLSLEQDFEGRSYCTVTVDSDPGKDLGALGQPGHRFFFDLDEVQPVEVEAAP